MAYGFTDDGKNAVVNDLLTRFAVTGGFVVGTDNTEANTDITNEEATTFVGSTAPAAGSATMTHKTANMVAATEYQEFGLKDGATLHNRGALDANVTGVIGSPIYFTCTISQA